MTHASAAPAIPVQAWMRAPRTIAVMTALEAAGGAGCARFVGGCVRDAIQGRPVEDIDIATTLRPEAVMAALKAAGLKAIPTGLDHGTVTAVSKGHPFEITTLRRDVATDGRRAVVAFTTDWAEDAQRRDFRLNALYADAAGRLYDPTGEGVADARAGRIVFVGDPAQRIREDALRILRFFRFQAWSGRGEPDAAALCACEAGQALLEGLSAERVSKELLKLLAAPDPRPAVGLMASGGILTRILPQAAGLTRFNQLVAIETDQFASGDPLLRLAALLEASPLHRPSGGPPPPEGEELAGPLSNSSPSGGGGPRSGGGGLSAEQVDGEDAQVAATVAQRLRLSNAQRDRLVAALGREPRLFSSMSPREARRAVYHLGAEAFRDRALLAWAEGDPAAGMQWLALIAIALSWPIPALPVAGADALAAGAPPGPAVGAALREVEAWWIDNDFPDDRLAAVERLKTVVEGMNP